MDISNRCFGVLMMLKSGHLLPLIWCFNDAEVWTSLTVALVFNDAEVWKSLTVALGF